MAKEWSVGEFKKAEEKDVTEVGEIDLHSVDAVEKVNSLRGTPVSMTPCPDPVAQPADPQGPVPPEPPEEGIPRILVVIPLLEVSFKFFESWHKFWTQCMTQFKGTIDIGAHFIYRKPVHIAETMGVNVAKYNKCTHVLFMDDDIYDITPDMVQMLLDADKDVIAGVMHASGFPYSQCTFRRFDVKTTVASQPAQTSMYRLYEIPCHCPHCMAENKVTNFGTNWSVDFCPICKKEIKDFAIQKVDLIPFPFTLIKMSVFDKINMPWFHCNHIFPTDSWFADRCIEAGIQQYAHMLVRLNHRGVTDATKPFLFQKDLNANQAAGRTVVVTPEDMKKHEMMIQHRMNEAETKFRYAEAAEFLRIENSEVSEISNEEVTQNDKEKKS